jgi:hypothetical protein
MMLNWIVFIILLRFAGYLLASNVPFRLVRHRCRIFRNNISPCNGTWLFFSQVRVVSVMDFKSKRRELIAALRRTNHKHIFFVYF